MINELAKQVHENNIAKGFFEKEKNIGEMLCLIHSEVSEALEADRKNSYVKISDAEIYFLGIPKVVGFDTENNDYNKHFTAQYERHIKGTFEEEMADIVIRVMDLCAFKGIDLEAHIKAKMRYNSLREFKHGKKY